MEWPIAVLVSVTVPIVLILFVLAIIRWDRLRAQRAVRSEEYWEEGPDGRRYPTGWDQRLPRGPTEADPHEGEEGREGPEPPGR
ncbi:hypothetical protein ACFXKD_06075 [Nocardiopsis aegyptia]|uniref:hypothetical protein n=1 Tax=Nocardiopsis aegyptia TaxID=220378 RepID=UPI00366D19FC